MSVAKPTNTSEAVVSLAPALYVSRFRSTEAQDFFDLGFCLAHFLLPDRTIALRILSGALNKLKSRVGQERKRAYWRDKFLKGHITRITRDEEDALQWLIYFESDSYEKEQEALARTSIEDMVVSYVKTLIRLSTGMSSFYVGVAIHRLLHRYTTSETQQIYEFVADDYREADEYRRAKKLLMLKLESRFGESLRSIKADRGELRYELAEDQEAWSELIVNCLQMFTPWSTKDKCPFKNRSGDRFQEALKTNCGETGNQDKIEGIRCHALIHPECCGYLVRELGLEPHFSRLGVPRFYMDVDGNPRPRSPRIPDSPLASQERQAIANELSAEDARRRNVTPQELRFVVDGVERGCLNLVESRGLCFNAPLGSQLLEIWAEDEKGPVLFATHIISEARIAHVEAGFVLHLNGRSSLSVALKESADEENPSGISVSIEEVNHESITSNIRSWLARMPAFPTYAGITVLLTTVFLLAGLWQALQKERAQESDLRAELERSQAKISSSRQPEPEMIRRYRLTPDDLITRGNNEVQENTVAIPPIPTVINFVLPITGIQGRYRAVLTPLDGKARILVEEAVSVHETAVMFSVPSNLLSSNKYYRIKLQDSISQNGRTFTFYTSPAQQ